LSKITIGLGVVLILLGVGCYSYLLAVRPDDASPTALIPAIAGVLFALLGLAALKEAWRMHVMHGAVALAILGGFGVASSVPKFFTWVGGGEVERELAVIAQFITLCLLVVYVVLGVGSFLRARTQRKGSSPVVQ
jgi:hypothetical protein